MHDDSPLTSIGDEPVEARIVAWVLGEASGFEAAELERMCDERPELLIFRRRMRALHGLLTDAEAAQPDHSWKLPPEKRQALDEILGKEKPKPRFADPQKERRIRRIGRRAWFAIAACLLLILAVCWMIPRKLMHAIASDAQGGAMASRNSMAPGRVPLTTELPPELIEGTPKPIRLPGMADVSESMMRLSDSSLSVGKNPGAAELTLKRENMETHGSGYGGSGGISNGATAADLLARNEEAAAPRQMKRNVSGPVDAKKPAAAPEPPGQPMGQRKTVMAEGAKSRMDLPDTGDRFSEMAGVSSLDHGTGAPGAGMSAGAGSAVQSARAARPRAVPAAPPPVVQPQAAAKIAAKETAVMKRVSDELTTLSPDAKPATAAPAKPSSNVAAGGSVTAGLRSGDQPIHRNNIDAILNNPDSGSDGNASLAKDNKQVADKVPELGDVPVLGAVRSDRPDRPDKSGSERPRPLGAVTAGAEELRKAVKDQEDKVEDRRKVLATIVRTKGIIYKGTDSFYGQSGVDEDQGARDALQTHQKLAQEKMRLESQINSLLKYDNDQLMTYAGGLDLPENTVKEVYPQYREAKRQLDGLKIQGLGDGHPTVRAAKDQITNMKRQLDEGVVNLRETMKAQLELADARLKSVEGMKDSTREDAIKRGLDAQDYLDAKKDFEKDAELLKQMKIKLMEQSIQPTNEAESRAGTQRVSGLAQREMTRSPSFLEDSDKLLEAARNDDARSDYQKAYDQYEKALNLLPDAPVTADRRANLLRLLGQAAVALANKAVVDGRNDDSRVWLNKAREWDPDNPQARQQWIADFTSETTAAQDPYSTFSLYISDASFQVARAACAKGERPDPEGIKVEQFYNAVDYGDLSPTAGEPVAVSIEQAAHPVIPGRNLVRVALKTSAAGRAASQALRLTLLVDQSGSMVRDDRRAAMDKALTGLASLLTKNDRVTVIGFARTPRLLADGWTGEQAAKLAELINQSANEGGTNLEEAIKLAEQLAERRRFAGAQNRIVLFTDGAANLGDAAPAHLAAKVKALRQKGIAFDIAGIAADDLNDGLLGELARNGNGRYYVVGKGADENLARQLAGAFRPAAENVKVQVHFNPERVNRFKLIGFEKDRLKTEDFRNDAVDAAELAAEEAGVAIYQVEPLPGGSGELGDVSVRFRDTASNQMVERTWTIPHDANAPAIDRAKPSMQLAVLAMFAGEKLRGGPLAEAIDFKQLAELRANVKRFYGNTGRVADVLHMIDSL